MHKIPTLFERDAKGKITAEVNVRARWLLHLERPNCVATEKLDGTNVRLTIRCGEVVRVEKRRNPTRRQKERGILDPWYVDAHIDDPDDRWIMEAVQGTDTSGWRDGAHSCEAIGPKIAANPLALKTHRCVPFFLDVLPRYEVPSLEHEALNAQFKDLESKYAPGRLAEGIVFYKVPVFGAPQRVKLKRRDFGFFETRDMPRPGKIENKR